VLLHVRLLRERVLLLRANGLQLLRQVGPQND
jgi:hypothetical protein